jgi:hypothetical protein
MLLVYVVGIPLMYFLLLHQNKEEIMRREDVEQTRDSATQTCDDLPDEDPHQPHLISRPSMAPAAHHHPMSSRAQRLAFLWDAYEPQFWYWEVVETTRRLMLTAVLSICGAGTSAQSVLAVLLGVVYIKLYGYYAPYERDADDVVAEVGQFQIFFTFLGALIQQKSLLGPQYNSLVSASLIIINATVTLLFLYYGYCALSEDFRESREMLHQQEHAPTKHAFKEAPAYMLEKSSIGLGSASFGSFDSLDFEMTPTLYPTANHSQLIATTEHHTKTSRIGEREGKRNVVDCEPDEGLLRRPHVVREHI